MTVRVHVAIQEEEWTLLTTCCDEDSHHQAFAVLLSHQRLRQHSFEQNGSTLQRFITLSRNKHFSLRKPTIFGQLNGP